MSGMFDGCCRGRAAIGPAAGTSAAIALLCCALAQAAALEVPLTLRDVAGVERRQEPCSSGVPLPHGLLREPEGLAVVDPEGNAIPAQFRVLERWRDHGAGRGDGSIKWLLVTFLADVPAAGQAVYRLQRGANPAPRRPARPVAALPCRLLLTPREGAVIAADGQEARREVVESGPVRACVKFETPTAHDGASFGYLAWVYTYADCDRVDLTVVLKNTPDELHGPLYFRDFSVRFETDSLTGARRYALGGEPGESVAGTLGGDPVYLHQAGDGTDQWQTLGGGDYRGAFVMDWSAEKTKAKAGVPEFGGYRVVEGERRLAEGRFALGWAALGSERGGAFVATRHFRENYPSAVEVEPGRITVRLLPKYYTGYGGLHWLDDSTRKRFDLSLLPLGEAAVEPAKRHEPINPARGDALAMAFDKPLVAHAGLEWYRATEIFGPLVGAAIDEAAARPRPLPLDYGSQAVNWVVFGGDVSDRIKRRYHDYPMTGFIRTGNPWEAYRTMIGAYHSSGMTPLWQDDYQFPRDKDRLTVRQYCSTARGKGEYLGDTGHHGFQTWNMAHFTCRELFDAWRLFGDPLARMAIDDAAAYNQVYADYRDGGGGTIAGTRSDGHPMNILAEAYRITGREDYLQSLKLLADVAWRQVDKQRGNYGVMESWEGGKENCEKPFMMCQVIEGLIDVWKIIGDERAADQILGMLDFILAEASLGEWGFSYVVKLDPGQQEPYRRELIEEMSRGGRTSYGHLAPTIAWGHWYSGEPRYREAIDGINAAVYPHQSRAYVNYYGERPAGDPPPPINDLKAEAQGGGRVRLTWTVPAGAAAVQIKHAERPMVERAWPDRVETHANWWAAEHIRGVPAPTPSGATASMVVEGLPPGRRFFAARAFNSQRQRSALGAMAAVEVR